MTRLRDITVTGLVLELTSAWKRSRYAGDPFLPKVVGTPEAQREATRQEIVARHRAAREAAGAETAPTVLSREDAEKARLAQRAKDDAAKDAARARLEKLGIIGKRGPARN